MLFSAYIEFFSKLEIQTVKDENVFVAKMKIKLNATLVQVSL